MRTIALVDSAKNPLTPAQVIKRNKRIVAKECPELIDLQCKRGHGALSAMINLGLIDADTYFREWAEIDKVAHKRLSALRGMTPNSFEKNARLAGGAV